MVRLYIFVLSLSIVRSNRNLNDLSSLHKGKKLSKANSKKSLFIHNYIPIFYLIVLYVNRREVIKEAELNLVRKYLDCSKF